MMETADSIIRCYFFYFMSQIKNISKKLLTNPAIVYIASRYATYVIQVINSLFIAVYLGPFYLGIWGFVQLIIQYIAQINLGIPHAVNVIVSIEKKNEDYVRKVIGNGVVMLLFLSLLVVLFFTANYFLNFNIGTKYNFQHYIIPVSIIGILGYYNSLFANIFRIYGKIMAIALNQSLFPVLMLLTIIFFKNEGLLWALVFVNLLSVLIAFFVFIIQRPVSFKPFYDWKIAQIIQKKGWHLFMYNASFYLIMLSTKSFISGYYSVKEFGFFTFSYSLAQAMLLFFEAISYLIFPKLINRFANSDNSHTSKILETARNVYITSAHALVHVVILIFPVFLYFFPKYETTFSVFALTVLTVTLYSNTFGYAGLLQARGKEKTLGKISLIALILNIVFVFLLILGLRVTYEYVIIATMLSYFLFVIILGIYGRKNLSLSISFRSIFEYVFPLRIALPFIISVMLIVFKGNYVLFLFPLLLFIILNYKNIFQIKSIIKQVVNNSNLINI